MDWPAVLRLLRADGPDALLGRLRLAERTGRFGLPADDASVAFVALRVDSRASRSTDG